MNNIKICTTGLQALDRISQLASVAKFVALGSFGFDTSLDIWKFLPKESQLVVGLPREEEKHSTILYRLAVFKKWRPDLHIGIRRDFHAKYGIFRLAKSRWVMLGSANCTPSPAQELVLFCQSEDLYHSAAKRHDRWFAHSEPVQPDNRKPLSRADLASLSTTIVSR